MSFVVASPPPPTPCVSPCPSVASVVKKTQPQKHNTRRLTPTPRLNTHQHHHPFVSFVPFVVASPPHPTPRDFPCPSVFFRGATQHPSSGTTPYRNQSALRALLACTLHTENRKLPSAPNRRPALAGPKPMAQIWRASHGSARVCGMDAAICTHPSHSRRHNNRRPENEWSDPELHTIRITVPQTFGKSLSMTQQPQHKIMRLHKQRGVRHLHKISHRDCVPAFQRRQRTEKSEIRAAE